MKQESYGLWLKVMILVIVLFLLAVSYFLYVFLFDYSSESMGASVIPLEDLDIEAYEQLKE